jgi:hypothetical protein
LVPVRVGESSGIAPPIRVRGRYLVLHHPHGDRLEFVPCVEVEDEQRLRVWIGRGVIPTSGELKMRARTRDIEEHTVVTVVINEATKFGKPDPVAVEGGYRLETISVTGDAELHDPGMVSHRDRMNLTRALRPCCR